VSNNGTAEFKKIFCFENKSILKNMSDAKALPITVFLSKYPILIMRRLINKSFLGSFILILGLCQETNRNVNKSVSMKTAVAGTYNNIGEA
jgi:hypothetical protein